VVLFVVVLGDSVEDVRKIFSRWSSGANLMTAKQVKRRKKEKE
jgi:hypothetical protein